MTPWTRTASAPQEAVARMTEWASFALPETYLDLVGRHDGATLVGALVEAPWPNAEGVERSALVLLPFGKPGPGWDIAGFNADNGRRGRLVFATSGGDDEFAMEAVGGSVAVSLRLRPRGRTTPWTAWP